ncbi:FHA domain-containing protein [Caballeronia sp. LZ065]|uniref:FHA domain-containing protein n=1 Tax=Caballeronia sp. LZ065 TaxID=3038571 RepID=UPI002855A65F|nr:FHA domain-containing protein [Caballeronia sp. LZ065]MDR5782064.1 FHA domain-containing protein [Caballeronia sp. LZ065]
MNGLPRIFVTSGLHAGASLPLEVDHDIEIGNDSEADLILADDRIAPRHARAQLHGPQLALFALADGVSIFGRPLKAGSRTLLDHGAAFCLGDTSLLFSHGEYPDEASTKQSEAAWLLRHAPLAWLRMRCGRVPRLAWIALAATPLALAAWLTLNPFATDAVPPPAPLLERPAFSQVRVETDKASGTRIYEGYVQTPADLAALSLAARARDRSVSVRVFVMQNIEEQLSDLLDQYYRGAQARVDKPGAFVVTLPGAGAHLKADSWDYALVARVAQSQIEGLRTLNFAGHENASGPARIPLENFGLNLVTSPHSAWLADAGGTRYFAGGRIAMGRIERIRECGASVVRDDGSVYDLTAQRSASGKPC